MRRLKLTGARAGQTEVAPRGPDPRAVRGASRAPPNLAPAALSLVSLPEARLPRRILGR